MPDGITVASASYDATIRLWDVQTGEPVGLYPFLGESRCFDFCPRNNMFACGDMGGNLNILRLIRETRER